MFTGLIEHTGRIQCLLPSAAGRRLEVDPRGWEHRPAPGESISINGCCLTIADDRAASGGPLAFDVVPETLSKTTLGNFAVGSAINLERSATPVTLLGGHVVQGHIDGLGQVIQVQTGGEHRLKIAADPALMEFITPKGAITVDGVSLTVAAIRVAGGPGLTSGDGGWFEVALIPTTLEKTTLSQLRTGDRVNLETDVLARTVVHWLKNFAGRNPA